jgi:hypothetical protein
MMMLPPIRQQLERELARAEAVVQSDNGTRKLHQPTIDNHRGQVVALRKALALLEIEETYPPGPIELKKQIIVSWRIIFATFTVAAIILWQSF